MPPAADPIKHQNVYAPAKDARVLAVLVPAMETSLTELRFRELLAERLTRLMQLWAAEVGADSTLHLLEKSSKEMDLPRPYPKRPKPIQWQTWARFLAQESDLIPQRLARLGVTFPVPIEQNPDQIGWLKELFAEPDIQPNLEEWLFEAMKQP